MSDTVPAYGSGTDCSRQPAMLVMREGQRLAKRVFPLTRSTGPHSRKMRLARGS